MQKSVISVFDSRKSSTRACPVQHRTQVHEAVLNRDIGDLRRPDLVQGSDLQTAQQVGMDLVGRMPMADVGLRYTASMPMRVISVDTSRRPIEWPSRLSRSRNIRAPPKRMVQMELVNSAHQRQIHCPNRRGRWYAVDRESSRSWHCRTIDSAWLRLIIALHSTIPP